MSRPSPALRTAFLDRAAASDVAGRPEKAAVAVSLADWVGRVDSTADRLLRPDADRIRAFADELEGQGDTSLATVARRAAEELEDALVPRAV